jgi:uncharacterized protein YcfJ
MLKINGRISVIAVVLFSLVTSTAFARGFYDRGYEPHQRFGNHRDYRDRGGRISFMTTQYTYTPVVYREPYYNDRVYYTSVQEPMRENQTKVAEGAAVGGILGALLGGVIGYQQKGDHALGGALLGGVAGATLGGIMGAQVPNETAAPVTVMPAPSVVSHVSPTFIPMTVPVKADERFSINVPKSQGSGYVVIVIKRSGNGFTGPQGEFYTEFPKVAQLQAMYGQ